MNLYSENIVLIDENNNAIGAQNKILGHNKDTKLHRGISLFLINQENKILLQKRSRLKKTWPEFWSNSVCGHPQLNETFIDAAIRCAKYELGVDLKSNNIEYVHYQIYDFIYNNIKEYELCYVFIVKISSDFINYNLSEVSNAKWQTIEEILLEIKNNKNEYTPWFLLWLPYVINHLK